MTDQHEKALSEEARDALILDHMPLLYHIVGQFAVDMPGGLDRDDLEGFAMVGLITAADSWDPARGLQFSTYAYPRIRGAVLDELRRMDFLPRGRRDRVRALDRHVSAFEQEHGRPPSPEELATGLDITEEEVDEILTSARSALRASLDDGPSGDLASLVSDPACSDPADSAEFSELRGLLSSAIADLPEREQTVVTLYYAEGLLLKEIGEVIGVTESRVSQIHGRALYRLNTLLGDRVEHA